MLPNHSEIMTKPPPIDVFPFRHAWKNDPIQNSSGTGRKDDRPDGFSKNRARAMVKGNQR